MMQKIDLPDYVCTPEKSFDLHPITVPDRSPVHVTMEVETAMSPEPLAQVVGLCGSPRWGVHATTPHRQVELDNKGGVHTGGLAYQWAWVYDVTLSYSPSGLVLDWADESRWLEAAKNRPPINQILFGLPPLPDGTYTPGWGPPLGWSFKL